MPITLKDVVAPAVLKAVDTLQASLEAMASRANAAARGTAYYDAGGGFFMPDASVQATMYFKKPDGTIAAVVTSAWVGTSAGLGPYPGWVLL
jgi:hypothetical protein